MAKGPSEIGGIKRSPPVRTITKQQAVRHLIHAAVRMIAAAEDPFAIHLLIQSADKLLIDFAKRSGKSLAHEWTDLIKPEYRQPVMRLIRETYNYLKHADTDHDEALHVGDIAESNVLQLAICVVNYHALFGEMTNHMSLLFACAQIVLPNGFVMQKDRAGFDLALTPISTLPFGEFFNLDLWQDPLTAQVLPNLAEERAEDLQDNERLFVTKIGDFPINLSRDQ
jgi:hypothetical protein